MGAPKLIFLIFIGISCISLFAAAAENKWPVEHQPPVISTTPNLSLTKERILTTNSPPTNENSENDDSENSDSANKVIIAVCVSIGCIILLIIIGIILCVVFREKISHTFFSSEKGGSQAGAPGSVFYSPQQFAHKGPLKIQKQARVDVNANYQDDKDLMPANAHFQFTEQSNEVYDIGSEVEQII